MLWDLYQQYRIGELDRKLDRVEGAERADGVARDAIGRLEEKLDRLALINRALFELLEAKIGITEPQLSAKVVEIDLRDGVEDGRLMPQPKTCPKCGAKMSPKFGRCLFCGEKDAAAPPWR